MSSTAATNPRASTGPLRELTGVQVLIVDKDEAVPRGMALLLADANLHVTGAADRERALQLVERNFYSVVMVDLDTPGPAAGMTVIRQIRQASPTSMIIGLTPRRSYEEAVAAIRAGAIDLVLKAPESVPYLRDRVTAAVDLSIGRREVDDALIDLRDVHEEFLQRFMDAERRAQDLADQVTGRDPSKLIELEELRVLVVDEVDGFYGPLVERAPPRFGFVHATSGGEAPHTATAGHFHYAMVALDISDLPTATVVRTLKAQHPELIVLTFRGPADNGRVDLVETAGTRPLIDPFSDVRQFIERLEEFAQAWAAKARERRYVQSFRERHYDFLRRYVEIRTKIERAMNEGPG
jgi:DNA-binding response OmpR family regulator